MIPQLSDLYRASTGCEARSWAKGQDVLRTSVVKSVASYRISLALHFVVWKTEPCRLQRFHCRAWS
jgi:hypothetical protein